MASEHSTVLADLQLSQPAQNPRMIVSCNVYHQVPGEDPSNFNFPGTSCFLNVHEKPWDRTITVGEEPVVLEWGWLKSLENVSCVMMHNINSLGKSRVPTAEEKQAAQLSVIEIVGKKIIIPNGMSLPPVFFEGEKELVVLCRKGTTRFRYVGIPK